MYRLTDLLLAGLLFVIALLASAHPSPVSRAIAIHTLSVQLLVVLGVLVKILVDRTST